MSGSAGGRCEGVFEAAKATKINKRFRRMIGNGFGGYDLQPKQSGCRFCAGGPKRLI
jgi:hypothetical protein